MNRQFNLRVRVSHQDFQDFAIELFLAGDPHELVAAPRRLEVTRIADSSGLVSQNYLTFSDFLVGDPNGSKMATENTPLKNSIGQIRVDVSEGTIVFADFKLLANF